MKEKVPDDKKMKYCSEARIRTHHAVRSIIPPEFQQQNPGRSAVQHCTYAHHTFLQLEILICPLSFYLELI